MAIYALNEYLWFPSAEEMDEGDIVAIGGDLSPERVLLAYQSGIFPWYNEDEPILWWCPKKRMVLFPGEERISKSSRNLINRAEFTYTFDQAFEEVIEACRNIDRKDQDGSWINEDLIASFVDLHKKGIAHSLECWKDDQLVGGLYGISIGTAFFGESMFSRVSNASKLGFFHLCRQLWGWGFEMIDCQLHNPYLESLGAHEIDRLEYMGHLHRCISQKGSSTTWVP